MVGKSAKIMVWETERNLKTIGAAKVLPHYWFSWSKRKRKYTWISLQLSSCILWWHWLKNKSRSTVVLLEIRPESAFTALGSSYQLLSDLVGCNSPLQIEMAVWRLFFKSEASHGYYYLQQAVMPNPANSNFKKMLQLTIIICRGLLHLPGWAVLPSENASQRLFQGPRNPLKIYCK